MKPDATSALPKRPAAAEDSPGRSLLPTEATATRPGAPSSGTLRKEGSNTARGCRESMQDKATGHGLSAFLLLWLSSASSWSEEEDPSISCDALLPGPVSQPLCVNATKLPCSWVNSRDEEQNTEKFTEELESPLAHSPG